MMTLSQLTALFGWASILNIGMLLFATILLFIARPVIVPIHKKMFDVSDSDLSLIYIKYLAHYKILTLVFIVTPYISLKIIGQ